MRGVFEQLFGSAALLAQILLALFAIALFAGLAAFFIRRSRAGGGDLRHRQPRLAVIEMAEVDQRRRLVLVRRDHVEHLLMIGGPTDIVVEATIARNRPPPLQVVASQPEVPAAPAKLVPALPSAQALRAENAPVRPAGAAVRADAPAGAEPRRPKPLQASSREEAAGESAEPAAGDGGVGAGPAGRATSLAAAGLAAGAAALAAAAGAGFKRKAPPDAVPPVPSGVLSPREDAPARGGAVLPAERNDGPHSRIAVVPVPLTPDAVDAAREEAGRAEAAPPRLSRLPELDLDMSEDASTRTGDKGSDADRPQLAPAPRGVPRKAARPQDGERPRGGGLARRAIRLEDDLLDGPPGVSAGMDIAGPPGRDDGPARPFLESGPGIPGGPDRLRAAIEEPSRNDDTRNADAAPAIETAGPAGPETAPHGAWREIGVDEGGTDAAAPQTPIPALADAPRPLAGVVEAAPERPEASRAGNAGPASVPLPTSRANPVAASLVPSLTPSARALEAAAPPPVKTGHPAPVFEAQGAPARRRAPGEGQMLEAASPRQNAAAEERPRSAERTTLGDLAKRLEMALAEQAASNVHSGPAAPAERPAAPPAAPRQGQRAALSPPAPSAPEEKPAAAPAQPAAAPEAKSGAPANEDTPVIDMQSRRKSAFDSLEDEMARLLGELTGEANRRG